MDAVGRAQFTRRRLVIVAVIAVALVAGGTGVWLLTRPQPVEVAETTTRTVTATRSTRTLSVGLTGTLAPRRQADLSFAVAGRVTRVPVEVGQRVRRDQALARIDSRQLADAVDLAEANLNAAKAGLDQARDADAGDAAVAAARAQVDSARARLASARESLADAVLRAPFDGTVAAVDVTVGDQVTPAAGATSALTGAPGAQVVVISTQTWKLEGTVGSADLGVLEPDQPATITPHGGGTLQGSVASVGIVATSASDGSATFPVVIRIAGRHPDLFSGTTASAVVVVREYPEVLTVPTAAITTRDGRAVVSRVTGTSSRVVEVTTGRVFGADTEILSGLDEGDQVLITIVRGPRAAPSTSGGGFGGMPPGGPPR